MNKRVKAWWLRALRSRKYFKKQLQLRGLRPDGKLGHCCLGVLCDLYAKSKEGRAAGAHWKDNVFYASSATIRGDRALLPRAVMEWAGLTDDNPIIIKKGVFKGTCRRYGRSASSVNDTTDGYSKVAAGIERNL